MGKGFDRFMNMFRMNDDDYDDYDDVDDTSDDMIDDYDDEDYDDIPAPVVKKKIFKKEASDKSKERSSVDHKTKKTTSVYKPSSQERSSAQGKIVPMKASRGEVCVLRPTVFEDAREISDVLLSGKTAVVNVEGIDMNIAQRIADFIFGSCYAMDGHIEKISNYIFIITPHSIEISGDIQDVISSGIRIASFDDNY